MYVARHIRPKLPRASSTAWAKMKEAPNNPTVAMNVDWKTYPKRFTWATKHNFALEYAPNPEKTDLTNTQLQPFVSEGIPIRFHGYFCNYELGHCNALSAKRR